LLSNHHIIFYFFRFFNVAQVGPWETSKKKKQFPKNFKNKWKQSSKYWDLLKQKQEEKTADTIVP
jgi:hypothetical protein